jgi:glyoxalase family protein
MQLTGIHHLTAVTSDAPRNHSFYTRTLGMRLVKKTVNQDDTSAYHLFYVDGEATPGSDITFFDWPVALEKRGTHSISRTGLRVAGEESLQWWKKRFENEGVTHGDIVERDGCKTLDFEGQRLSLIDDGAPFLEGRRPQIEAGLKPL